MKIKQIEINGLHGNINKRLSFHDSLNLLVGINGSGKTSVLNAIEWMLCRNIPRLAMTRFDSICLEFNHRGSNYLLKATKDSKNLFISLTSPIGPQLAPVHVTITDDTYDADDEGSPQWRHYSALGPEKSEVPLWQFLTSLPKPTVVTLDRTISAELGKQGYVEETAQTDRQRILRKGKSSPLEYVTRVVSEKYSIYRAEVAELNEILKAKLVMSALRNPAQVMEPAKQRRMTKQEIDSLEKKVIKYLSTSIKGEQVTEHVRDFFRGTRHLVEPGYKSNLLSKKIRNTMYPEDLFWNIATSKYDQINELAIAFNDYEKKSTESYRKLSNYLNTVNKFLEDSKKAIEIEEKSGKIGFRFLENGKPAGEMRNINYLSSGERQILTLLTFVAFVDDPDRLFILDEPELSLHPKWQSEFLDAFLSLKAKSTQILLATHSPDIVGDKKTACVVLKA